MHMSIFPPSVFQESISLKGMQFMRNTLAYKPKAAKDPLFITEWFYLVRPRSLEKSSGRRRCIFR